MHKITMPDNVNFIIDILNANGFDAFVVGGCVRDSLLGREPKDWDLTTNANPDEIISVFKNTKFNPIPTGLKHGTLTLELNKDCYEVTTYRLDGNYSDNRRPDSVEFTSSFKEDLARRDFTINAIGYNPKQGLMDYFEGISDLNTGIIKCVGDPHRRFSEDALRMLRAIRFMVQLGFNIEKETFEAIRKNKHLIRSISVERINAEFCKMLTSDNPAIAIDMLNASGLLKYILPELCECIGFDQHSKHHDKDVYGHIISVLKNTPSNIILRLAALLHDIGKLQTFSIDEKGEGHFYSHHLKSAEMAEVILKRLRFDNETVRIVSLLVREHMSRFDFLRDTSIKKFINKIGIDNLDNLFELQIADIKGSKPPHDFSAVCKLRKECRRIIEEKHPLTVKDLAIKGQDLKELGFTEGKIIGDVLRYLLELVMEDESLNDREKLISMVKGRFI